MPWQYRLLNTAMELDENGSLYYSEVRVSVPRQSAKTTSTLWVFIDRLMNSERRGWGKRPQCRYTAQTASAAREKLIGDWMPAVQDSEYDLDVKQYLMSNGKEGMIFENGGKLATFPPTGTGAHGSTIDVVAVDEAFAHVDGRVETGSRPAMITRTSPQIWVSSTAGTLDSLYWRSKVDDGRRRVEANDGGRVCYVEYSAGPDDDIDSPEQWGRWMPALGHTITVEAIQREHDTITEDEFRRAYGNEWTGSVTQIIPARQWAACAAPKTPRAGKAWLAVDASPGVEDQGKAATISLASYRGDEIHVEVLAHRPGLSWVAGKLAELTRTHSVECVLVDDTGPVRQILHDLKQKSAANVEVIDAPTMVAACGRFHQAVLDRSVRHSNQPMLDEAVRGAVRRQLVDGWALARAKSSTDISPLVSCVLAHWVAACNPETGIILMYTNPKANA